MPRKRKHVTDRSSNNIFAYQQAYDELLSGKSLRKAAKMFDLDHVSLARYKIKRESAPENTPVEDIAMSYNLAKKIFAPAQENEIVTYAIKSADIYFGLTAKDMRKLAYHLTVRYKLRRPASLDENEIAGVEWFRGFLDYCRDNGIVMLAFPPHCSHKLQPLDRTVYGPFKKAVNTACEGWLRANPGKTMTIYDISSIVTIAFPRAMTLSNIQAGFRVTGICPYNSQVFSDLDFAPSYVTDRPNPNMQ